MPKCNTIRNASEWISFLSYFSSNLDFNSDPSQVFRLLVYLTKITFWDLKSGFPIPTVGIFKQISLGFSSKIGIIPTKSGWLHNLTVLHFTLKYEQYACPQTPTTARGILTSFRYKKSQSVQKTDLTSSAWINL